MSYSTALYFVYSCKPGTLSASAPGTSSGASAPGTSTGAPPGAPPGAPGAPGALAVFSDFKASTAGTLLLEHESEGEAGAEDEGEALDSPGEALGRCFLAAGITGGDIG